MGGALGRRRGRRAPARGILTQALSWPWIFFVNLPIGVLAVALAARFVPESRAWVGERGTDIAGAVSITGGHRAAHLRDRQDAVQRLGIGDDTGPRCARDRADRGVRPDRGAHARATGAAGNLPRPCARGRRRGAVLPRRGDVRELLLRHALPPGRPALQPDRHRLRVPSRRRADRGGRRNQPAGGSALRDPCRRRHGHHDRRSRPRADGANRRALDVRGHAAALVRAARLRPRDRVRAGDADRRLERLQRRRRAGVRALQHRPADRRRTRSRDPRDDRGDAHERPAGRRGRHASTSAQIAATVSGYRSRSSSPPG